MVIIMKHSRYLYIDRVPLPKLNLYKRLNVSTEHKIDFGKPIPKYEISR